MTSASDPALASGVAPPDAAAVLDLLAAYLVTDLGRAELGRLRFHRDREDLQALHRRLAQTQLWIEQRGGFQFSALETDPRSLLSRPDLDGLELLQLRVFLEAGASLRDRVLGDADANWSDLAAIAAGVPDFTELRRLLHAALLPNGELDDAASPELARLRRQRGHQRQLIEASLARHLRQLGEEGALQDELVTVRHERFVVPVRAEMRRRAPGIVHGASSSGQTVFVEPLETVELNNEYTRLQEDEQLEVRRILAALSAAVAAESAAIFRAAEVWGVLELEAAKARFAADYSAHPAEFGAGLDLLDARHPLLVASERQNPEHPVVPLSLCLGDPRVLVVSGPNTGGKTVVLKTVAVAAWMAQCGLPVCARQARLPVFDSIGAEIGDQQSIERNLSTFSSHILHTRELLHGASPDSLVVLDEVGAATNPAEGAALAVEIVASLAACGAWTLASTHHDGLKAWAAGHPELAVNGSLAVDPETLAPSFQFRQGVPGLSAGLDMAERLGLPAALVAAARARLTDEERQTGAYLQQLQQQLAQADEQLAALGLRAAELDARERDLEFKTRELDARDRTHLQRQLAALRAELDRRLAKFNADAEARWRAATEALAAELSAAQKRKLTLAATRLKRETASAFEAEVASTLQPASPAPAAPLPDPQPGDRIRLRQSSAVARVLRRLPDGGFEIEAGAVRLRVPAADIVAVVEAAPAAPAHRAPDAPLLAEVNLIGLHREEAVEKLERFLDQALLADTAQVRIVHGAGFGVLRQAVADTLRRHPQVARFSHPPQNQGGQGVTLVELR